jgi:hypothetical protein
MTKYLAGVLSVIAVGVLAIAYGLIVPRAAALDTRPVIALTQPVPDGVQPAAEPAFGRRAPAVAAEYGVADDLVLVAPGGGYRTAAPASGRRARAVRTVVVEPEQEVVTRAVVREPRRNWKKTALLIGGSTAAGAGAGGIMGGKKGALIGAAIGGGASTIYETTKQHDGKAVR